MLGLRQTHGSEDCGSNITQHSLARVLKTPALGRVGHDEGHLVSGVASLGLAVGELHLLSIAMISCDEKNVALLLAALQDLANSLVTGLDTDNGGIVLEVNTLGGVRLEYGLI